MKKKILSALAGIALLAGCSDNTSPDGFQRKFTRNDCSTNNTSDPRRVTRFCSDTRGTPLSGIFEAKNKLGETQREHYMDGYVIFAERFNPSGELLFRLNAIVKNGLLMHIDSIARYPHETEPFYIRFTTEFQDKWHKSIVYEYGEAMPVFINCGYYDETREPVFKIASSFDCPK